MQLAIEVSLYPLDQQYKPYIKDFIARMNKHTDLVVKTSHTNTLISGEFDYIMQIVQAEIKATYEQVGQAIFVCKFLNATDMNLQD